MAITARELMARRPATVDVEVKAWGSTVRLQRLDGPRKLEFALGAQRLIRGDDGRVAIGEPVNWGFAVDLLAASIVDDQGVLQFGATPEASWLASEIEAIGELIPHALRLNGLIAADEEQAEIDAAKKD